MKQPLGAHRLLPKAWYNDLCEIITVASIRGYLGGRYFGWESLHESIPVFEVGSLLRPRVLDTSVSIIYSPWNRLRKFFWGGSQIKSRLEA